jgi:hypothetical protein
MENWAVKAPPRFKILFEIKPTGSSSTNILSLNTRLNHLPPPRLKTSSCSIHDDAHDDLRGILCESLMPLPWFVK